VKGEKKKGRGQGHTKSGTVQHIKKPHKMRKEKKKKKKESRKKKKRTSLIIAKNRKTQDGRRRVPCSWKHPRTQSGTKGGGAHVREERLKTKKGG